MERNVPKLRFKGFNDEWNELKVSDTLKIRHGKDQKKIECENGEYPILATGGEIGRTDTPIYDKESVLIGRKGTIDRPIYMNTPFWTVDTLFYSEIHNNYIPKFIYYKFQCINWKKYCEASGVPSLSASTIESVKYKLPSLQEQERIANFLTKVDKIIEKQEEKVKNLENYKKGMMQKIFSQEIRFKDENGEEYPEWEEKKLGSIFNISAGGDISRENVSERKAGKYIYPIYSNSLNNDGLYGYSDIYKINNETITVTGRGTVGVAKARYEKYYPIVRLLVLNPKIKCNIKFFEEAINNTKIFIESTGVPQLTAPQLSDLKIKYACINEQEKIANILFNIDNIIEKEKNKLEKLIQWKKGLLQKMFV